MEGWSESVRELGWDPECPVECARGKDSVVGKLPHVRGNWPLLHNTDTGHSCVTLALCPAFSEPVTHECQGPPLVPSEHSVELFHVAINGGGEFEFSPDSGTWPLRFKTGCGIISSARWLTSRASFPPADPYRLNEGEMM